MDGITHQALFLGKEKLHVFPGLYRGLCKYREVARGGEKNLPKRLVCERAINVSQAKST